MTPADTQVATTHRRRIRGRRAVTVASSVGAAAAGWAVAVPLLGVELTVRRGSGAVEHITLPAVVAASLLAGLAGWALLALLERWTSIASSVWRVVAVLVFSVSLLGPLVGATSGAATTVLIGLHGLVAAVLVPALPGDRPVRHPPGRAGAVNV